MAAVPMCVALLFGDALYGGIVYYAMVFGATLFLCMLFKPAPLFTLGASAALLVTFAAYWAVQISRTSPDGLLILGHVCSLPGAAFGLLCGTWFSRYKPVAPLAAAAVGFGTVLVGFFLNQLIVCNTVMWCGVLSLPIE